MANEQVGILTCPDSNCDNFGTEFERPSKYCNLCGAELKVVNYPETEEKEN